MVPRGSIEPDDRGFFMFGSANRDEAWLWRSRTTDITRDTSRASRSRGQQLLRRRPLRRAEMGRMSRAEQFWAA